nr:hypothetical protein [Tanacetum cinerariifolium]
LDLPQELIDATKSFTLFLSTNDEASVTKSSIINRTAVPIRSRCKNGGIDLVTGDGGADLVKGAKVAVLVKSPGGKVYMLDSDEMKKNVVNDLMINNSQPMFDSDLSLDMGWNIPTKIDEMKKNVVNEANDLIMIPMLDLDLSLDMSWSDLDTFDVSWLDSDMSWINNYPEHGDTHTFDMNFHHGVQV